MEWMEKLKTTSMRSAIIAISTRSLIAIWWYFEYQTSILKDFTKTKIIVTTDRISSVRAMLIFPTSESHSCVISPRCETCTYTAEITL